MPIRHMAPLSRILTVAHVCKSAGVLPGASVSAALPSPKNKFLTEDSGQGSWKTLAPMGGEERSSRSSIAPKQICTRGGPVSCRLRTHALDCFQLEKAEMFSGLHVKARAGTGLTPSAKASSWQKWMQLWPAAAVIPDFQPITAKATSTHEANNGSIAKDTAQQIIGACHFRLSITTVRQVGKLWMSPPHNPAMLTPPPFLPWAFNVDLIWTPNVPNTR